jgi:hypothetical protein
VRRAHIVLCLLALTAVIASCNSPTTRTGQGSNSSETKTRTPAQSRFPPPVSKSPPSTSAGTYNECHTLYRWFHLWHMKDSLVPPGLQGQMFRELESSSDIELATDARSWQAAWNGTNPSTGVKYLSAAGQRCLALGQVDPYVAA